MTGPHRTAHIGHLQGFPGAQKIMLLPALPSPWAPALSALRSKPEPEPSSCPKLLQVLRAE